MLFPDTRERGNILFLILLAIALFAALIAVVRSSSSGSAKDSSGEKAEIFATALLDHTALMTNVVQRMKLMNNVPDYGFDLRPTSNGWTNRCVTASCDLYNTQGGNLTEYQPVVEMFHSQFVGSFSIGNSNYKFNPYVVRIKGVGTDDAGDIVVTLNYLSEAVCRQINILSGVGDVYPIDGPATATTRYELSTDVVPDPPAGQMIGDAAPEVVGHDAFCVRNTNFSNNQAVFYKVLIPR